MPAVKKFGVPLDLNRFEIRNAKVEQVATLPAGLTAGDKGLYVMDANGVLRVWDGNAWTLKATDADALEGNTFADVVTEMETRDQTVQTAATTAVTDLRTEVQGWFNDAVASTTADHASIRADFATGDNAVRGEFAAADTQVRQEFAAADEALRASLTSAFTDADTQLRTDLNAADASIRTDFAAADSALDASLREYVDNLQSTTSSGTTEAVNAERDARIAADNSIRTDFAAADQAVRDYADSINTALTASLGQLDTDVTAALSSLETSLRGEIASGDAAVTSAYQAADDAVRAAFAAADAQLNTDLLNAIETVRQGLTLRDAVRVVLTENTALDSAVSVVDGVTLAAGDRVLVLGQTNAAENGLYVVAGDGTLDRAADPIVDGTSVWVTEGDALANRMYTQLNTLDTIGTDPQQWVQAGGTSYYTAGGGLYQPDPQTIAVAVGDGLVVDDLGQLATDNATVAHKVVGEIVGGADFEAINHGLNTRHVHVTIFETATGEEIEFQTVRTGPNTVTVNFGDVVAADTLSYAVIG